MVIQEADEGNIIVILNKNNYISTLNQILDDTSKLKKAPSHGRQSLKSYNSYGTEYYGFT